MSPAPGADWRGPVFVVGFPRSGTTLVQQILNAHPAIAIAPETHFMGRYWRYRHLRGPLRNDTVWAQLLRDIAAEPGFRESGVTADGILARADAAERSWPGALGLVMRTFADAREARIAGEKTPLHQLHMPRLQEWFPDARFVQVVRDPRAVVSSWRNVPWSSGSAVRDALEWRRRDRIARADEAGIRELLTVRYEDLVMAPDAAVATLCAFLGIEPTEEMLAARASVGVSTRREPWKEGATDPVRTDRVAAWKAELGRGRALAVEAITRSEMERHGYRPARPWIVGALAGPPVRAAAGLIDLWHRHVRPLLFGSSDDEAPVTVLTDAFRGAPNPYIGLLADAVRSADPAFRFEAFRPRAVLARSRPGLWHMQWPASRAAKGGTARALFDVAALMVAVLVCRVRGIPMVWTVHNVAPHERRRRWLSDRFMGWLAPRLSAWISLSRAGVGIAADRYPALRRVPHIVVRHGHYASAYDDPPTQHAARRELGIRGDAVLLALGTIRPYKRLPALARAFAAVERDGLSLVIAGEARELETARELEAAIAPGIDFRPGAVPATRIPAYLAAADGFVLPADRILNSGSALLALTFGVPVLVPDTPVMAELRDEVGSDAVFLRDGDLDAAQFMAFVDAARAADREAIAERTRAVHAWPPIGRAVAGLYRDVLGERGETA